MSSLQIQSLVVLVVGGMDSAVFVQNQQFCQNRVDLLKLKLNPQYLYSVNSRNGINTTTSTAAKPTNVNQELCPPNQCDGSAIDIAKSGLDR